MVTVEEQVNCVLQLAEMKSVTAVKRRFTDHYRKDASHRNYINIWMKKLKETGSMNDKPQSEETVTSPGSL
jgi:hypothetical protein